MSDLRNIRYIKFPVHIKSGSTVLEPRTWWNDAMYVIIINLLCRLHTNATHVFPAANNRTCATLPKSSDFDFFLPAGLFLRFA